MELTAIRCNIKKLRKLAGITQKEMAAKLFIEERTYSKIERGEQKSMDIRFVASIADILHTKVCTLLQDPMEQPVLQPAAVAEETETEHDHSCGMAVTKTKQWDIALEIRMLKEEIRELVSFHKETLKLLKNDP
jgi:transcriptional regulator with XRE-family HTH domain